MQNHSLVPGYFAGWSCTIPFNFKTKKIFAESGLQTLQIFGSMRVATTDIASIGGIIFLCSKMLAVYSQNWHFLDPSDTDMPSTALDTFLTCLALPPATGLRNHPQKSRDLYLASKNCHKNSTKTLHLQQLLEFIYLFPLSDSSEALHSPTLYRAASSGSITAKEETACEKASVRSKGQKQFANPVCSSDRKEAKRRIEPAGVPARWWPLRL